MRGFKLAFIFLGIGVSKWKKIEVKLFIQTESSIEFIYLTRVLSVLIMFT